ncbi:transient receptor potential cation channel subfamily V member 2-like [Sceloporus undulatus]|uniref:transient receptor potential cation channel subfamily V member 2-like n=1 Tax=Sceloporus undulatus TaxID=8520 RepID=UPI001C4CFA81|nr:transient receptor potential cation channel subfamily V member 2-like [Sceloporus undulatus]
MQANPLVLETDDGTATGAEAAEKWDGGSDEAPRPLETPFQKETPASPRIRVNLNYRPGLVNPKDPNRFDRDRLFSAIVRGRPEELEGLKEYLQKTCKFLTNSEYTDGRTGKTCLMKALLNLKDGANPTIPLLLKIDKETENPRPLINTACSDSYYKGHTPLHIAIEKRNLDLVELLVANGVDVHAKACGKFFHQKKKGACFYFGELPLSLAACTNQMDVIQYLLHNSHQKARLTEQDSLGNTVLHALVMVANDTEKNTEMVVEMYDEILMEGARINPTWKLEEIVNKQGLTPLKLAVKTGKVEIFKHILQREIQDPEYRHLSRKFTEWTYGPVQISLYDLSSIDSFEENSVLEILAYSSDTPNRYKMVVLEPVNRLLQHKWDTFASWRFYLSFVSYMMFMAVFSAVGYHRPLDGKPPFPVTLNAGDIWRFLGQLVVLFGGIYLFLAQSLYLWRRRLLWKSLLMDGCIDIFLLVQSLALLLSAITYLAGLEEYIPLMVFSLLLGWVNMLYYTRGFQQTGIYIVMIQKAILRDLLHFLMVYVIFLFGFSTALVILTGTAPQSVQNGSLPAGDASEGQVRYTGLLKTSLELFKFTIGMGELEFHENVKFKYFVMLLLLLFVVLTYILLLNMLIALMSETVTNVSGDSQSVWKLQRAIAILEIEKNWFWCWKKTPRAGCLLSVGLEGKKDERWCFRVEELNWADWKRELGALKEDPMDSGFPSEKKESVWSWVSNLTEAHLATPEEMEEQVPLHAISH